MVNSNTAPKVPSVWYCRILRKTVAISSEAIPNEQYGWICDCGEWVQGNSASHIIEAYVVI